MISKNDAHSPENITKRVLSFIEFIQSKGIDVERVTGMTKQARLNYRQRLNIPASKTLFMWSTKFDLSIDWLLRGEGTMLITNREHLDFNKDTAAHEEKNRDALLDKLFTKNDLLHDRIAELTSENATLRAKAVFLEGEGKHQQELGVTPASGSGSAAHILQRKTE